MHVTENGARSDRKFVGEEHARAQYEKLLAKKLAEGFERASAPAPREEVWPPPEDLEALAVAADERQTRGDPRGELAAIQIELARAEGSGGDTSPWVERSLRHVSRNGDAIFGALARHAVATTAGSTTTKR